MAGKKNATTKRDDRRTDKVTRRGFIAAFGAASAAAVLPAGTAGARDMTEYEQIRERVALALRQRFAASEFRGWTDEDSRAMETSGRGEYTPPIWKLEKACARLVRNLGEAFAVLEESPHAAAGWQYFEVNGELRSRHVNGKKPATAAEIMLDEARGKAGYALAHDVLLIARERGWYRPATGEEPSTAELRSAA